MTAKTVYAFALPPATEPLNVFSALYRFPYTQFLDSTDPQQKGGRYSTIVFQPVEIIEAWGDKVTVTNRDQQLSLRGNITTLLQERLDVWGNGPVMADPTMPPFQGGAVGYFGFGIQNIVQKVTDIPQAAFGIYDQCISFDHSENQAWHVVISENPELAKAKHAHFLRLSAHDYLPAADSVQPGLSWAPRTLPAPLIENVRRLTDYIQAGSFDHSFLCQFYESDVPAGYDILAHYAGLHRQAKTPLGACMALGGLNILVMNAEPLFTVSDREIEMPYISHRTARPEGTLRDDVIAREMADDKEAIIAHQKMAKEQTVRLSALCSAEGILGPSTPRVEPSSHDYHLTSVTRGVLGDKVTLSDLLTAFTPAQAFSGTPADRALRVVTDMEPCSRGPAFGHTAVISFTGTMTVSLNTEVVINNGSHLRYAAGLAVDGNTKPAQWYDQLVQNAEIALARIGSDTNVKETKTA